MWTTEHLPQMSWRWWGVIIRFLHRYSMMSECCHQGRTDNPWGPWAIGDHGAPVSLSKLKKSL
ncbi:unnamed protein product [Staurois parvus]|uniref:Uncharacterized protein n=1 Tax=Staurois parvus TaxID=386267 RepID=A0ABN9BC48_9NEOB|nr:unnamed protein product [Staurois parvus]